MSTELHLVVKSGNAGHKLYVNGKYTGICLQDGVAMDRYIDRKYAKYASLAWA